MSGYADQLRLHSFGLLYIICMHMPCLLLCALEKDPTHFPYHLQQEVSLLRTSFIWKVHKPTV